MSSAVLSAVFQWFQARSLLDLPGLQLDRHASQASLPGSKVATYPLFTLSVPCPPVIHNVLLLCCRSEICHTWEASLPGGKDHFRPVTGLPVSTYFSAYKFQWMQENVPQVRSSKGASAVDAAGKRAAACRRGWVAVVHLLLCLQVPMDERKRARGAAAAAAAGQYLASQRRPVTSRETAHLAE